MQKPFIIILLELNLLTITAMLHLDTLLCLITLDVSMCFGNASMNIYAFETEHVSKFILSFGTCPMLCDLQPSPASCHHVAKERISTLLL